MDFRALASGIAFALIWSSAFSSARIIVLEAPPFTSLAIRFAISGSIGIAIAACLGQTIRLTRDQWRATAVFGTCQNAIYLGVNFVAMQWIAASLAAIIASTMPLIVAFFNRVIFRERIGRMGAFGLIAGFLGVVLVVSDRLDASAELAGIVLCILGVLGLSIATLTVRNAVSGGNLLMIVGLQMLVGCAILAVPAAIFETWNVEWSLKLGAAFAYSILVPGLIATWIWFQLVDRVGATRASAFHFLNPFFGVAVAAALLGESMDLGDIGGVAVISAGILAVQLSKRKSTA
ncbi:MAG: DMT family transporter [Albidovulum sp.]|nr:DMT family transporter [Albidovulum sp.]MDE0305211.1 DMT family transporter [Albidovulum sp.]MDE0534154.1 DMT family transporter [Albidovulum sp.]